MWIQRKINAENQWIGRDNTKWHRCFIIIMVLKRHYYKLTYAKDKNVNFTVKFAKKKLLIAFKGAIQNIE